MCKLKHREGEDLERAVTALRGLRDHIGALLSLEVGVDLKRSPISYDIAAVACFADWDALARYSADPKYKEVVGLLRELCESFAVVDYESS